MPRFTACVFDLDGTLLDSDEALIAPFVALGVRRDAITFGHVLTEECRRLGLRVEDYLAHYDTELASPYAGVVEVLDRLPRWAVCSNKDGDTGRAELARLGWQPEVALFADDFGGPKRLGPVLEAMAAEPDSVLFVGDTDHDRMCARQAGAGFAWAGWNPRSRPDPGDLVLSCPADLLALISSSAP